MKHHLLPTARLATVSTKSHQDGAQATVHDDESKNGRSVSKRTFTSTRMKVVIEDTDLYGGVYYRNYLKYYDRALQQEQNQATTPSVFLPPSEDDRILVAMGDQKFRSSPPLGGEFVIRGTLQEETSDNRRQIWNLSMTSVDGGTTYHTANNVVLAPSPPPPAPSGGTTNDDNDTVRTNWQASSTDTFVAYRDEFDLAMRSHLPLDSVLCHMERARTNFCGGPEEVLKLREEGTGIRDLRLVPHKKLSLVGEVLTVESWYHVRKGGMRVDVLQTLSSASSGERVAQGIVTCYTLNKKTFRPTSNLPPRLLDRYTGGQKN